MALDAAVPVAVVDALPGDGNYQGELIFADEALYIWAGGAWVEIGSGGGKESEPYIDFEQFKVIERSDRFDYDPLFETNPIATYKWEYQLDLVGNGNFVEVSLLNDGIKNDIGWYCSNTESHLRLKETDEPDAFIP